MYRKRRGFRSRASFIGRGEQKKWDYRVLIIGGILLFILLFLLFLLFYTDIFGKEDSFTALDLSESAEIDAYDEASIYYLKGTSLYRIDKNNEIVWTSKFSSDKLELAVGKKIVCLYNEQTATILDADKNPLFNIPSSDFIISEVVCGESSVALLSYIKGESTQYIRIFDMDGKEVDRVELPNTTVLKFGFYGADNLWYLTLDTTGVEPICRITTMSPTQQKITGLHEVYGQLVSDVCFFESDVYISDTNSLIAYDTFGEKIAEWLVYGSKQVDTYTTKDDLILAYVPTTSIDGSIYTVRILSCSGTDLSIQLPSGIEYFALSEKHVYCFSESIIYLYDYTGKFVKSITPDFSITSFRKLCDNLILLGGKQGLSLFALD